MDRWQVRRYRRTWEMHTPYPMKAFGREIAKQAVTKEPEKAPDKPTKAQTKSALGFVLATAEETLISDICKMLREKQMHSLEGYVFCLSRVVKHDEAWHCVCEAFRKCNVPVPGKYYSLFGKQIGQEAKSPRVTVV